MSSCNPARLVEEFYTQGGFSIEATVGRPDHSTHALFNGVN
jgi:hypothetical protein